MPKNAGNLIFEPHFFKFSGGADPPRKQVPLALVIGGAEGALNARVQISPFFTWISSFSISIYQFYRSQGWQPCFENLILQNCSTEFYDIAHTHGPWYV